MTDQRGLLRFRRACGRVRGRMRATAAATGVTLVLAAVFVLSLIPESLREGRGSPVPLIVGLVVLLALAAMAVWTRRIAPRLAPEVLADEADAAAGLGEGDVRGAFELAEPVAGRSKELVELHRVRVARILEDVPPDGLLPRSGGKWSRRLRLGLAASGMAALALAGSALVRPGPTLSAALAISAPWRTAFPSPLPPLALSVDGRVLRGEFTRVSIEALGRAAVELVSRPAGEVSVRSLVAMDSSGHAVESVGPIISPTRIWVEDEHGAPSDTLVVRPAEPLLVQDLQIHVQYPAYLGRAEETHRGQIPPLVTPEGTRLTISGETNLPLSIGELLFSPPGASAGEEAPDRETVALSLDGPGFGTTLVPRRSGTWSWVMDAEDAVGTPIIPEPLRVLLVPDLAPRVQLLFPAPDTTLGSDRVMPIVVDVEDDIGLRSVALRSWRSGLGAERAERRETLAPGPDGSRRAVFRHLIDRSDQELLPGDTVFYRFEAFDGHPTRGPAISEIFLLRIPTFTEMRDERADETRGLSDDAESLEEAMDRLAESAAEAARRIEADEAGEAQFETTEEARAVLEDAEAAVDELTELEQRMEDLASDVEDSAVADEALKEQLDMLAERYRELMESGLAEQIEELAAALQDLDPEAVREALEQLSDDSEWLRDQLEQTLGMLDQAALDQEMKSAQANAEDLAQEQRELAESASETDDFVDQQEELAQDAEQLAEALDELQQRLEESGQQAAADSAATAGERTRSAMESMEEASNAGQQAGEQQAGEQSSESASEAADAMEQAAEALGAAQQNMEESGREAAAESLGRARAEALSLADEEGRLADATRGDEAQDPETWRSRQNAVRQGLENMLDRLSEAGNEAAMLDQQTGAMAGEAIERMDQLLERLAEDGARRLPSRAEAEGIQESLNRLAMQLLAGEQAARSAQEQTQGQEAAEQMASLAQQQQAITQETSSLLMPGPKPSGEERTQEAARQQQEIAEQLSDIEDPEGDLLGRPEELAREAEELARQMADSGPTQETLERQRRLFRRMLDAGRSLEDEDMDPNRRESTTGTAVERAAPDIDPELLRGRRFPLPPEELLRDLPIFYRPLIFEYFDRLNRPRGETRPNREPPGSSASGEGSSSGRV